MLRKILRAKDVIEKKRGHYQITPLFVPELEAVVSSELLLLPNVPRGEYRLAQERLRSDRARDN